MSAEVAQEAGPARGKPRKGRRGRVILGIAGVCVLFVGFEVGVRLVPPDAVRVTASAADGRTLAVHEIGDARTVADLYARINGLPSSGVLSPGGCTLHGSDAVTYSFRFTRWGLPIEAATLPGDGCFRWRLSRGGLPDLSSHVAQGDDTTAILNDAQPLPAMP